ncbi:hypothetical protein QTP70_028744 [Hemibagrus guttatus]|uniref:Uncharacterized protein n=1 Tax=Hemibagrus guttatus TaxID=175788 RepID=A0AAE0Q4T2_9TELE|nr:hypothetical protein QTP70_028744 [Hemibagrus guttatus]
MILSMCRVRVTHAGRMIVFFHVPVPGQEMWESDEVAESVLSTAAKWLWRGVWAALMGGNHFAGSGKVLKTVPAFDHLTILLCIYSTDIQIISWLYTTSSCHLLFTVPLRKSLSIQNMAQIEAPWEGVTLNRCLFIAITILVLSSGCQRLHEFLRGRKDGTDLEPIGTALSVRHTAVKKYRVPAPEPETSLWDTFLWWVDDDEDNDDEEGSRRGKVRKVTREKATRGLRHKAIPDRRLLKWRDGRFKARRDKARQGEEESRESVKAQREKVKRLGEKKVEEEEREEKEEKVVKNRKESKKIAI